jgi:GlpG protein
MRYIGNVPTELDSVRLGDHLFLMGVDVQVEPAGGEWEVWVRDEDKVEVGRRELAQYRQAPADPRYHAAQVEAERKRRSLERERRQSQSLQRDGREAFGGGVRRRRGLVLLVIILSSFVFLYTERGSIVSPVTRDLLFVEVKPSTTRNPADVWASIRSGEVWRLVTPAFLHFSWPHIIMNLLALSHFGGMIEDRRGTARLAAMFLLFAVVSNIGQAVWSPANPFGGLSGVLFGLFGYLWMMTHFRPDSGLAIRSETIMFTLIFFAVCIASSLEGLAPTLGQWLPPVANAAHTAGLVAGIAWGLWDARRRS